MIQDKKFQFLLTERLFKLKSINQAIFERLHFY